MSSSVAINELNTNWLYLLLKPSKQSPRNVVKCGRFEEPDKQYTIVNFNDWVGAATYLEVQACKRHMMVYHLTDESYVAYGYQTDEDRDFTPVTEDSLVLPEEEDYPF